MMPWALDLLPKGINPEDTKYIIDAVGILEEKTRGNLTLQEEEPCRMSSMNSG